MVVLSCINLILANAFSAAFSDLQDVEGKVGIRALHIKVQGNLGLHDVENSASTTSPAHYCLLVFLGR